MSRPDIEHRLQHTLRLRDQEHKILINRENSLLEFKETFNLANMPSYARTMAAFANAEGGYIVFGVKRSPHALLGIKRERFDSIDPVKVPQFLNSHLAPEIEWDWGVITISDTDLGYLYTGPNDSRPVVATSNASNELTEGDIYYRYRGQTTRIRYPELQSILIARLERERRAWVQHLDTISKSGPLNVAVLDSLRGRVFGGDTSFLIDEKLLNQINVIKNGRLVESGGTPAITLVGELKTVSGVTTEKIINRGIHYDELVTSFLASRPIEPDTAKAYLVEAAFQQSIYTPIFYFIQLARLSERDAIALVQGALTPYTSTKRGLATRISGEKRVPTESSEAITLTPPLTDAGVVRAMNNARTIKKQREILLAYLRAKPEIIGSMTHSLPSAGLLHAILSLTRAEVKKSDKTVRGLLLSLYINKFSTFQSLEKTLFRRAVAYTDEALFA